MPKLIEINIKNFRGIQSAKIVFDKKIKTDVLTLVGLNESGKTTVLEALSLFSTGDRRIPNLLAAENNADHMFSLIPIQKRAAFSDSIEISAFVSISKDEWNKYATSAERKFGISIDRKELPDNIEIKKLYNYIDSKFSSSNNIWNGIKLVVKSKGSKKYKAYTRPNGDGQNNDDVWLFVVNSIESEFFKFVYFPTFLVDMPQRIYLEEHDSETPHNRYYRQVIDDILESIDTNLDIEKHIISRLKEAKTTNPVAEWFSIFLGKSERKNIDSVANKIQAAINREIIGTWVKVFKQKSASSRVKVTWGVDAEKQDMAYVTFDITDGENDFSISERSLGFRWFFTYLLFTQFSSKTKQPILYIFDEPAANLHAKAQSELVESISRILDGKNKVIYSTHSPHMIKPAWLNGAYIVENRAIDFDTGDEFELISDRMNDIIATPYAQFLSTHSAKSTYFQPIWEKLLYESPPIIGEGPYLLVEGISDFHFLNYCSQFLKSKIDFSLVPGVGAGSIESRLPSVYASGRKFIALLDDDAAGRKEKRRLIENGILADDQVYTLADIEAKYSGKKLETIISDETKKIISRKHDGKSGKKQVKMYMAEACALGQIGALSHETITNGKGIISWASSKFSDL